MKLLILLSVLGASWAEQQLLVYPPLRYEPPPPTNETLPESRTVFTSWVVMPVDHFNPQNTDTFLMRFMFNDEFFAGEGSPIFIMIGGEWAITENWLRTGNMYEMARENNGFQIYTEHRYYGQTLPYFSFTTENLRFLNVDQALADLAHFIVQMKSIPRFATSEFILYGGSYAANMALWFKQRYPHLVKGVVASSGPILAEVDFTGYLEVVHDAFLSEGGEQCIGVIRQGILDTMEAIRTEQGRQTLERAYRICEAFPLDYDDRFTMAYFAGLITWSFSWEVQLAVPGTIIDVCRNFADETYGTTPMEKLGGYIAVRQGLQSCWVINYENYVNSYINTNPTAGRAWYYQTCTEYGYFQTAPRSGTVFDPLHWMNVEFYVDVCKRAFDPRFDEEYVFAAIDRVNEVFGGLQPNVNNTINIHGAIDPWHALGVHETDLKDTSPTFTVPRASHCFDMRAWSARDTIRMSQVQQEARRIVASWLSN